MAGSDYVQSVTRAIDIVESLARTGGAGVQDLARELALEPSTVQNLLRTLGHRSWVTGSGKPAVYQVGTALIAAMQAIAGDSLLGRARRAMREAQAVAVTGLTYTCTERRGLDISGVLFLTPDGRFSDPNIEIMPPYSKPSTLAYQAFGTPEFLRAFRHRWQFYSFNGGVWPDEAALDAFLATSREQGLVLLPRGISANELSAAAPVFSVNGDVVATLGVYGPLPSDTNISIILDALKRAAISTSSMER